MKAMINVGNEVNKEFSQNLGELIATVFKSGYENRMDQTTIQYALDVIKDIVEVKNVNITNSNFTHDDRVVNQVNKKEGE